MKKQPQPTKGSERLLKYLERAKMTDAELAEQLGVHRTYVGMLLRHERTPGLEVAFAIQDATKIPARSWLPA